MYLRGHVLLMLEHSNTYPKRNYFIVFFIMQGLYVIYLSTLEYKWSYSQ